MIKHTRRIALALVLAAAAAATADALEQESRRLTQAKDYIAEEQYLLAIKQLRAAVADPKETRRDEALYWLADSLNHSGDPGAALETIRDLEREFPSSIWVKTARHLRIDIAVRLNRSDVLWWTALTTPAPAVPRRAGPRAPKGPPEPPSAESAAPVPKAAQAAREKPPPPPAMWYSDAISPDADLVIQALGGLMRTEADKAIVLLRKIALESEDPGPACRAVFWIAQSGLPEARETVVQVAKTGREPVRVAAVRELGRFYKGPQVSKELLMVYPTAQDQVKAQIVQVLADHSEQNALQRIVETEKEFTLRSRAIVSLGKAGGVEPLAAMYKSAGFQGKRPIIMGLFIGRGEAQLIRIAEAEHDAALRKEVLEQLRLLGTPKATAYLQKVAEKR